MVCDGRAYRANHPTIQLSNLPNHQTFQTIQLSNLLNHQTFQTIQLSNLPNHQTSPTIKLSKPSNHPNHPNHPTIQTINKMNDKGLYTGLTQAKQRGEKKLAVLFDPDKMRLGRMEQALELAVECDIDYFFIGGSLVVNNMLDEVLAGIRQRCSIPMILFPGNSFQLSYRADGLLFLSLISGRNPELLIGQHVISAPFLKMSPLEIISTGYILIDGGVQTSVQYMSNTYPIPAQKDDIAVCTALAGELLGLKIMYLDAGSGARNPVSESMIESVCSAVSVPLIVGGGIRTPEKITANFRAGADVVVVGNAIEKDPGLIREMAAAKAELNQNL
jgi:phosphoglycerol geranylgeranyltransferase